MHVSFRVPIWQAGPWAGFERQKPGVTLRHDFGCRWRNASESFDCEHNFPRPCDVDPNLANEATRIDLLPRFHWFHCAPRQDTDTGALAAVFQMLDELS